MNSQTIQILLSMILYMAAVIGIGLLFSRVANKSSENYFLGGRSLGPWVTAMSAEASDMSGWLLMGVPGVVYISGLCNIWIIMIVLLREFTITSFRLVATAQGVVIPANFYGKLKTVSQMVFSILIMLGLFISEFVELEFGTFSFVSNILLIMYD